MPLIEDLLSNRELIVFMGVENHSTPYNPLLFNRIWIIPDSIPSKNLLIIPIKGIDESYKLTKEKMICYGQPFWVLFVDSPYFSHYVFLFDSFPQTDDNNYFTQNQLQFLQKINCCTFAICDIGIYKSRSLIHMLNCAISSLGRFNISICLVTILGYNSRGYTDIEKEDEMSTYQKEYYLHCDIESPLQNENFNFIQIDGKINLSELSVICSLTKSQVEIYLQQIKHDAKSYDTLKTLWDYGFFCKFINTLNKGESFDFVSLEKNLSKMGFKGYLIDNYWESIYQRLCQSIKMANQNDRISSVEELISAIGNNIISTINYVNLI